MRPVVFEVYGTPQPAGSKRAFAWRAKDGRSGTSVVDANPKAKDWKLQVAAAAGAAHAGPLLEGPLAVTFIFDVVRPRGHFGTRGLKPSAPARPTVKPDLLKLSRAVEDAMSGIVYRDDAQIVIENLEKRYGERARLLVSIRRPWDVSSTGAATEYSKKSEQPSLITEAR